MEIGKGNALLRERAHIRSLVVGATKAQQVAPAQVISEDVDDVRQRTGAWYHYESNAYTHSNQAEATAI